MALFKRINTKAKALMNSGFGGNPSNYGGRFFNKNGSANIKKKGIGFLDGISWYHTLLDLPTWKFLSILFLFYIGINFVFAFLYYGIGIENLNGISASDSPWVQFGEAYFFSAQTFTTVGYGHISPVGFLTSALSSAEALIGLLSFAIATGLFFGRFSKPTVYLKFSHNAVIAPYQDGKALMFRLAPFKNTNYIDAEVTITVGMNVEENGVLINKFYILDLEMSKINSLVLSWTLVHPITETSPFYLFTSEDFETIQGEILVILKTFDDMFSTTVATRTSYRFSEIIYGAKFKLMFERSYKNTQTILNLDLLNSFENVTL
ncbi:ion channel [Flavobacterium restrictum]|uniref:Inward rectifier potassium channel Irk n=1 Tax=Flavobacterium restrictum TaxID=2594428 RepID=A0A553E2L1_9FLAO|nr:ion channel [Flavobacterium restrictum]TRX39274.1 Inward rectifier potassium channel Irk [Flavobacterium restrictum]